MKFTGKLILILCACVGLTEAQITRNIPLPTFPRIPGLPQIPHPQRAAATHPEAMPPNVIPAICPEAGAVCGYVPVPLDRRRPKRKTIQIYFEMYPHTNAGPAQSAILANFGGPGVTTTGSRDWVQFLFASNLDVHDLLIT